MSFAKYNEKGDLIRNRVVVDCQQAIKDGEQIRTEQSHKKEVDINQIVKRHAGRMDLIAKTANMQTLVFDDVTGNDFQEAAIIIAKAEQSFNAMPSKLRNQFNNSPAEFLDFVQNPDNSQALIDMGLATAPPPPEVVQVNVTNETLNTQTAETPPAE